MNTWKTMTGKRCLVQEATLPPYECTVAEVAPDGEFVKLNALGFGIRWVPIKDISILKVLTTESTLLLEKS